MAIIVAILIIGWSAAVYDTILFLLNDARHDLPFTADCTGKNDFTRVKPPVSPPLLRLCPSNKFSVKTTTLKVSFMRSGKRG
jgi:hypothetical protein